MALSTSSAAATGARRVRPSSLERHPLTSSAGDTPALDDAWASTQAPPPPSAPHLLPVAIEVDGPWHYVAEVQTGSTLDDATCAEGGADGNIPYGMGYGMGGGGGDDGGDGDNEGVRSDAQEREMELIFSGGSGGDVARGSDSQLPSARAVDSTGAIVSAPRGRPNPPPVLDLLTIYRRWLLRSFGWRVVPLPLADHATHLLNRSLAHRRAYVERRMAECGASWEGR